MHNLQAVRTALAAAVDTQGRDFVYNPGGRKPCYSVKVPAGFVDHHHMFIPVDAPCTITACLVGVALDILGIQEHHQDQYIGHRIAEVAAVFPHLLTDAAVRYLSNAQVAQDLGHSWGVAYDAAETGVGFILANYSDEVTA